MSTRKYIHNKLREYLKEDFGIEAGRFFDSFPESVKKTLFDEYGDFRHNFDWNSKQDEFRDNPEGFRDWMKSNDKNEFINQLDNLIKKTTQDLTLLKKRRVISNQLKAFEALIIPSLGTNALTQAMTKYEEMVMMSTMLSLKDMEEELKDAQNILTPDGSIDHRKIEMSQVFTGGEISIPGFEGFVKDNPEFRGVYNDWKKLYDKDFEFNFTKELNAYRGSTSEARIKELRDFLIQFKQRNLN